MLRLCLITLCLDDGFGSMLLQQLRHGRLMQCTRLVTERDLPAVCTHSWLLLC